MNSKQRRENMKKGNRVRDLQGMFCGFIAVSALMSPPAQAVGLSTLAQLREVDMGRLRGEQGGGESIPTPEKVLALMQEILVQKDNFAAIVFDGRGGDVGRWKLTAEFYCRTEKMLFNRLNARNHKRDG